MAIRREFKIGIVVFMAVGLPIGFVTMVAPNWAVPVGLGIVASVVALWMRRWLFYHHSETQAAFRRLNALTALSAVKLEVPLAWSSMAMQPDTLLAILGDVIGSGRKLVVECGSGMSTIYLAKCLSARKQGRVIAIEHDSTWADYVNQLLVVNGLADIAEVVVAPLKDTVIEGRSCRWYDPDVLNELPIPEGIDLLLVDGPPEDTGVMARAPALPFFHDYLASHSRIFLDDTNRLEERMIADAWAAQFKLQTDFSEQGHGHCIMRPVQDGEPKGLADTSLA